MMRIKWPNLLLREVAYGPLIDDPGDVSWLVGQGFRSILSLESLSCYVMQEIEKQNLRYFYIPIPDHTAPSQEQIDKALDFIEKSPKPVYVHCLGGIGRSATIAACWFVSRGLEPQEAIIRCGGLEIPSQVESVYDFYQRILKHQSSKSTTDG